MGRVIDAGRVTLLAAGITVAMSGCGGGQKLYRVPSEAMLPTLHLNDVVASDSGALGAHPPLGAIVTFHPPAGAGGSNGPECGNPDQGAGHSQPCGVPTDAESTETFIKRIVGLPGDTIAIVNGQVVRNGRTESRSYQLTPCNSELECNFPRPITVPPDEYFVLGDNRPESDDSRFWGPVKRSWLIGLVHVVKSAS